MGIRRLFSGSDGPVFRHNPVKAGPLELVGTLETDDIKELSIAFSPDGRHLATSFAEKSFLWDAVSLSIKRTIAGETLQSAFSYDGEHLVAYHPSKGQVHVIEVRTGKVVNRLDAGRLLTGDEPIGAWGVSVGARFGRPKPHLLMSMRPVYKYSDHDDRYERMAQDRAGSCVIADAFSGQVLARFPNRSGREVSPDGGYWILSSLGPPRVQSIYDLTTFKPAYTAQDYVQQYRFSQDGCYVCLMSAKQPRVVKLSEGDVVRQVAIDIQRVPRAYMKYRMYSLPDTVWILDADNSVLLDAVTGDVACDLEDFPAPKNLFVDPSGRYLLGIDGRHTLHLRDMEKGDETALTDNRISPQAMITFSPGKDLLFLGLHSGPGILRGGQPISVIRLDR